MGLGDRGGSGRRGGAPNAAASPRQSTHVGRDNPYLGTYRRVHPCGTIAGCQSCLAGPAADEPPNGQCDHNQHKCGSSSGKQVCGRESERRRRRRMEGILDGGCVLSAVAPGRPTTQPWAPICRLWTREKAEGHPESARCRERQGEGSVAGALRPLCCQHLPGAFDGSGRVAGFPPPCAPPCARGKEVGQNCHAARLWQMQMGAQGCRADQGNPQRTRLSGTCTSR